MVKISWSHLQYERERAYHDRIMPFLKSIKKQTNVAKRIQQQENEFFKHLSNSVKIDSLPKFQPLLVKLCEVLQTELRINLFLIQYPVAFAASMPREGAKGDGKLREIIIIVSQHFLNFLEPAEQLSILGHEVAHLFYGHMDVPGKIILTTKSSLVQHSTLKHDTLKWMICSEISCDIVGFLACGHDEQSFCTAMLKFTTGISPSLIHSEGFFPQLRKISFQQLDDIYNSVFDPVLSSHPMTPLRLKLSELFGSSALMGKYSQTVSEKELASLRNEYNQQIDHEVGRIYPDIIPQSVTGRDIDIAYDMCLAVALADGSITADEILSIRKILGSGTRINTRFPRMLGGLDKAKAKAVTSKIITSAVLRAKNANLSKADIIRLVRKMLIVAASNRVVENEELDVIYDFAGEFGITQQDIVILVNQMGLR